jgi:hypothetical protein
MQSMTTDDEGMGRRPTRNGRRFRFLQFRLRSWFLVVLFLAPWCLLARQWLPSGDSLEARLSRPVELQFHKVPIQTVLDDLARQAKTPIEVNWLHAAAVGVDAWTPVTVSLCERVPLRTALFLVLYPLELGHVPSGKDCLRVVAPIVTAAEMREVGFCGMADQTAVE